eukprot:63543_1
MAEVKPVNKPDDSSGGGGMTDGISAAAAVVSTIGGIVGNAKSADAARSVTITINNQTQYLIGYVSQTQAHGGITLDWNNIPPMQKAVIRCESGGLMTGVEGTITLSQKAVPILTKENVKDFFEDEKDQQAVAKKLLQDDKVVYIPSKAREVSQFVVYVDNPFSGGNSYKMTLKENGQKEVSQSGDGPTGKKTIKWAAAKGLQVEWNGSASNKATLNIDFTF